MQNNWTMKTQEITFKCRKCEYDIGYGWVYCGKCGEKIMWDSVIRTYTDKYLEIYEVFV
jgi:hypothetical protein